MSGISPIVTDGFKFTPSLIVTRGYGSGAAIVPTTATVPAKPNRIEPVQFATPFVDLPARTVASQFWQPWFSRLVSSINRIFTKLDTFVSVKDFGAIGDGVADDTAAINLAYSALVDNGGVIYFPVGTYKFTTGLLFNTVGKMVTLVGQPGSASELYYSTASGDSITFNCGNDLDMGFGMRDLRLRGVSSTSSARGLVLGGTNGAQGFYGSNLRIEGFGTGVEYGNHTWITSFHHSIIRDCTTLLLVPDGLTESGEALDWDHVTFADSVSPHTNAVWIKGTTETMFRACSFDQAQLSIGNSTTSGAQVNCTDCHFENPNLGTNYDFWKVSNHLGNYLRMVNCYAVQAKSSSAPTQLGTFSGGKVFISGFGMYTYASLTNFVVLANAVNVEVFGFNDISGSISGNLLGGTTTGFVVNLSGANTANTTPRNIVMKAGDAVGGAMFDLGGPLRATQVGTTGRLYPGTDAGALQTAAGIFAGTGAPSNANGNDGDFYLRSNGGAGTTIYQRRSGSWVGIL